MFISECVQVREEAEAVATRCKADIRVSSLAVDSAAVQRDIFLHIGQIVVSTPGQVAQVLPCQILNLSLNSVLYCPMRNLHGIPACGWWPDNGSLYLRGLCCGSPGVWEFCCPQSCCEALQLRVESTADWISVNSLCGKYTVSLLPPADSGTAILALEPRWMQQR